MTPREDLSPTTPTVGIRPPETFTFHPGLPVVSTGSGRHLTTQPRQPFGPPAAITGPAGYDVLDRIAASHMSVVYRVRERATGETLALKVLKLTVFDVASARQRFAREVRTMACIRHPHLVPIVAADEVDGVPYLLMRYLPGGTLAAKTHAPLPAGEATALVRQAADGVAALHAAGVLHRDLKPSNVLLDDAGRPVVADFGLVKWADDDDHTLTGLRNGTPPYMSPEQVAGRSRRLTPACDVWALGVILYELLTGRRPFDDDDREALFRAIREAPPEHPSALAPTVPGPLADIVLRCLTKDPLGRYPSAAELRDDLDRFLAGEQPFATADATATCPPAPATRHRWLRWAASGVVGAAVVAASFAWLRPTPPLPPAPTFAEQVTAALRDGHPVELVGPTGRPAWSRVVPDGAVQELNPVDGTFTVRAGPYGWVELFADPLPGPVRVECEVCYRLLPAAGAGHAAVYLGRRTWPAAGGPWQTAAHLRHDPPRPPAGEAAVIEWRVHPLTAAAPPHAHQVTDPPVWLPAGQPARDRWVTLAFDRLADDRLTGSCDGVPVVPAAGQTGPAFPARLDKLVAALLRPLTPPTDPPTAPPVPPAFAAAPTLFGPGVGVFVWNATVSVRNVRLVPLPPAPPGEK